MPPEDVISFSRGAPSLDIVDIDGLKAAAVKALEDDPARIAGYGTSVGYPPLREWIAAKHDVDTDQVIVTNGSMQADAFLFDQYVKPDSPVIVERPTYDRTLLGLRNRRGDLHPVTVEADGLNVDEVEAALKRGLRPVLAHIIPNFQNPAGVTLSLEKRQRLVALADEYDFTIFEDDPYLDIRFRGDNLPTMLSMESDDRVVFASSFSKTVCPGLRTGYLVGPADVIAKIAKQATNTYIAPNMFAQATIYQFALSGALEESIKNVKHALAERADTLAAALREHLPQSHCVVPDGGYFLWVDLGEDVEVDKLLPAATARGVQVVKGTDFVIDGGHHSLRLAYSAVRPERIDEGVRRMAQAIEDCRLADTRL
ncbi:MAG TPA: PLP-dependent aminotransferase family protein [Stackebrandtia sp.]|jgi:DNA-binding transcriptional MocR family regulator|uniref:aminotransferase-like domain-containing protein n=1 Tax=Stackebrandtia sp. TaxID=2023065 RepID=UPI002D26679E|nr:PLP-dependent aminotransferase family protein [Stackebrandtia sp.]HZE37867.1 PLP-dependent aminotransferase family protein [Stackebrandtia sp.]